MYHYNIVLYRVFNVPCLNSPDPKAYSLNDYYIIHISIYKYYINESTDTYLEVIVYQHMNLGEIMNVAEVVEVVGVVVVVEAVQWKVVEVVEVVEVVVVINLI